MSKLRQRRPADRTVGSDAIRHFRRSAIALGVAAILVAPAYAQDAQTTTADESTTSELDRIVVTGVRGSLTKAQIIKETTDQIVDSIVAEDIGKLPDNNVAEALQRISGVQITRNKGEGSTIMVRGLTQVRSELNGRDIFTANSGRGLSWEDVPAELLAGIDVYKNPNAELIEGGIGGLVNLRTRMPFDADGMKLMGSFTVNRWDLRDSVQPSASFLFSNRWQTGVGEMGFLFNIAHQEGQYREDRINFGSYLADDDVPGFEGQQVVIPSELGMYSHFGDRERDGLAAAFQWKPSDDLELYAQGLRSDYKFRNREYSVRAGNFNNNADDLVNWSGGKWGYVAPSDAFPDPFGFDGNGEFRHGTFSNAQVTTTSRMDWRNSVTSDISAGAKWQANDALHLSTDFQYVDATTEGVNYWVDLLAGTLDDPNDWRGWSGIYGMPPVRVDVTGKHPRIGVYDPQTGAEIPGYMSDINNYSGWMSHLDKRDDNDADQFSWRADLRWDFLDSSFLRDLRVGARYTDRDSITRSSTWNWQKIPPPGSDNAWGTWAAVPLDQFPDACYRLFPFENHFRGESGLPTGFVACDEMVADYENTVRMFGHDPVSYNAATDIREFKERTYAAYAMLRVGGDSGRFPWDANAGVRLVRTETTVDGWTREPEVPVDALVPVSVKHAYTDVLPSFNFRMFLMPELQWRVAASRAMSRPNFDLLDPFVSLSNTFFDFNTGGVAFASRGNPYLEPMYSNQFDTSLEWYFGQGSMLYGTAFYKQVEGFYFYDTVTTNYYDPAFTVPVEGGTGETRACVGEECVRPFELQTRANGEDGKIKGLEVGYRQMFASGFGFETNYTYVDSSAPAPDAMSTDGIEIAYLPLEGLSKHSYNVVVLFERERFSARAAYNWRDTWLVTTRPPNAGNVPQFHDATGQLDASLQFYLDKVWSISIDGTNLLDETRFDYYGNESRPNGWYINDRRFGLTVRANLNL